MVLVKIGTRGSPLAMWQAEHVSESLQKISGGALTTEILTFKTSGDQLTTERLINSGGKGLFTKEIDLAVDDGRVDIAVHSLKDVPSLLPPGQSLVAFSAREDPREGFLCTKASSPMDLPEGAIVGTASLRREAQTLAMRPDLKIVPFRGTVGTRMRKLEEGQADATYLAMAGLVRMGMADQAHAIEIEDMLPSPCQGIVAIAARANTLEPSVAAALAEFNDTASATCAAIERAYLAALDGSCRTPIAGHARIKGDMIHFEGAVFAVDGKEVWRSERSMALADATPASLKALGEAAALEIKESAGGSLPQFEDPVA
ncbi:MAG: hydroxymethylbilane synthase [Pseudomonadota bacterium]